MLQPSAFHPKPLATFRPSWTLFLRYKVLSVSLWSLVFGLGAFAIAYGVIGSPYPNSVPETPLEIIMAAIVYIVGAVFAMTGYMFIFGELSGWKNLKGETWNVTHSAIHLSNQSTHDTGQVDFTEIATLHKHYPNAIRLRLKNGLAVVIRYIPDRDAKFELLSKQLAVHQPIERP